MNYLFVYGTLKKGCQFNSLLSTSKFLGKAKTIKKYALYFFKYPYILKNKRISFILGEVYSVSKNILKKIDIFEDIEDKVYYRELIKVELLENKQIITAWCYFGNPSKFSLNAKLIFNGEYKCRKSLL